MRLAILFALVSLSAFGQSRVILLSLDGLKPSTLRDAEKAGLHLPNLIEMRDKGLFSQGLVGVFPTVTYPSHTAMITGLRPADSGIYSNALFDPENRKRGMWFYFTEAIKQPTLWDAARKAGKKVGAVSWPVSVGAPIDYNIPEITEMLTDDQIMLVRSVSTKGLFAEIEKAIGEVKEGGTIDDMLRARQAAYILKNKKPDLMLVHLFDLDHEQHVHGIGSPQANHALEGIDKAVGVLRAAADPSTKWVIVSDHGFWPVKKAFHPRAFLASLGVADSDKPGAKWRIAAHNNAGSSAFVSRDPNDTAAQQLVLKMLRAAAANPEFGIEHVLDRKDLEKWNAYPHAFAAISVARGFTTGSAVSGPWVTASTASAGTHGFLPGPEELDSTFLAFGPGIPSGRLPRGELVDVARTVAALLGVDLPTAGGRNLLAK